MPRNKAGQGSQRVLLAGLLAGEDEGTGAVTDAARRAGRHGAVLEEGAGELREGLEGSARFVVFVLGDGNGSLAALHINGSNFGIQHAPLLRCGETFLCADSILLAVAAGDVVLLGEVLSSDAHGRVGVGVGKRRPEGVLQVVVGPELRAKANVPHDKGELAHVLGPRGDGDGRVPLHDVRRGRDNALEPRAAETVHGEAAVPDAHA
mmetsp:Transcript_13157/g.37352  ORF Transcript_13157/g.37352 Transcript_13157/m.37352 type:complete len:207 (+) Transcript_13157:341-961(+)